MDRCKWIALACPNWRWVEHPYISKFSYWISISNIIKTKFGVEKKRIVKHTMDRNQYTSIRWQKNSYFVFMEIDVWIISHCFEKQVISRYFENVSSNCIKQWKFDWKPAKKKLANQVYDKYYVISIIRPYISSFDWRKQKHQPMFFKWTHETHQKTNKRCVANFNLHWIRRRKKSGNVKKKMKYIFKKNINCK